MSGPNRLVEGNRAEVLAFTVPAPSSPTASSAASSAASSRPSSPLSSPPSSPVSSSSPLAQCQNCQSRKSGTRRWLRLTGGADRELFHGLYCNVQPRARPEWLSFSMRVTCPEFSGACLALDGDFNDWSGEGAPCALMLSYVGDDNLARLTRDGIHATPRSLAISFASVRPLNFTEWRRRAGHQNDQQLPMASHMDIQSLGPLCPDHEVRVAVHFKWAPHGRSMESSGKCSVYMDGQLRAKGIHFTAPRGIGSLALFNYRRDADCYFSGIYLGCDVPPEVFLGKASRRGANRKRYNVVPVFRRERSRAKMGYRSCEQMLFGTILALILAVVLASMNGKVVTSSTMH